jgi:putative transposase
VGKANQKEKSEKQYKTTTIIVKRSNKKLNQYCEDSSKLAKLFKNAVIFRCRQLICAHQKHYENLSDNELEVLAEFANIDTSFMFEKYWTLPNYYQFDAMFKVTNNLDYYNDLAMQSKQQIIKEVLESFKGYHKALTSYYKDSSNFTGKPKLPGYVKSDKITFSITNQDATVKANYKKVKKPIGVTKNGKTKYKTERSCLHV